MLKKLRKNSEQWAKMQQLQKPQITQCFVRLLANHVFFAAVYFNLNLKRQDS